MAFGYVDELISDEIPDPIAYYQEVVRAKEAERVALLAEETRPRAFTQPAEIHIGHFLFSIFVTCRRNMLYYGYLWSRVSFADE